MQKLEQNLKLTNNCAKLYILKYNNLGFKDISSF